MRLHTFSMFGMPRLPREDRQHWEIGEGSDNSVAIEKSWKELVPGHKVSLSPWGPRHTHTHTPHLWPRGGKGCGKWGPQGQHLEACH